MSPIRVPGDLDRWIRFLKTLAGFHGAARNSEPRVWVKNRTQKRKLFAVAVAKPGWEEVVLFAADLESGR